MIDALTTSGTAVAGNSVDTGGLPAQANFTDVERFRAAMMAPQGCSQRPWWPRLPRPHPRPYQLPPPCPRR